MEIWKKSFFQFKIGQDHSMRAALDDLANLISSFFVDSDLVPSDVLAGLLLAYHSPNNQYPPVQEKNAGALYRTENFEKIIFFPFLKKF